MQTVGEFAKKIIADPIIQYRLNDKGVELNSILSEANSSSRLFREGNRTLINSGLTEN